MRVVALAAVVVVSYLGVVWGTVLYPQDSDAWLFALSLVGFPVVGFLILLRRPGHSIGRLVVAPVFFVGNSLWLVVLAEADSAPMGLRISAELVSEVFWYFLFASMGLLVIYFPHSVITRRVDRFARTALISAISLAVVATLILPRRLDITGQPNPIGYDAPGSIAEWLNGEQSLLLFVAILLVALTGLVLRWRASGGIERLQFRWFGLGVVFFVFALLISNLSSPESLANKLGFTAALLVLPAVIGLTILRHRLYEIDRIVSRTITYAIVVGILGLMFFGAVTVVTALIPAQNSLAVAGATLLMAATFNPLRRRVQNRADRRFNRSKYDTENVITDFTQTLSANTDSQDITTGLLTTVNTALQPSTASIWVKEQTSPPRP